MEKKLPEYFPPSPRGSEQEVKEEIEEKDAEYDKTSCKLQDDGNTLNHLSLVDIFHCIVPY